MKIIALIGDQPNHRFLCQRINNEFGLTAVVVVKKKTRNKKLLPFRALEKILFFPLSSAWKNMQLDFKEHLKNFQSSKLLEVGDVNSTKVLDLIDKVKPDLIVVSGTNLLKENLIAEGSKFGKIMNLHTGISPYVKGGPNCTNWCLFNRKFHLIGNSIMWIDSGIDTGNLIYTEKTDISGSESLTELHKKVINHAHSMYLSCIDKFIKRENLPNVPQCDIAAGETFYTRQWGIIAKASALFNFFCYFNKSNIAGKISDVRFVSIHQNSKNTEPK